jgi:hypothetical protein
MGLGDRKKAMTLLEQAFSQHDHALIDLKVSPVFDDLHGDPMFEDLLNSNRFCSRLKEF